MKVALQRLQATTGPLMILGGTLVCLCVQSAHANEAEEIKAIKAVYEKHSRAFRQKDIKTLLSVLTPDCTVKDHGVEIGVAQLKAAFSQQASRIQSIKEYREEVTAPRIHQKQATLTLHVTFSGRVKDAQGKVHAVDEKGISEDTLIKTRQGEWKVKHSETKDFQVVLDGNKIDPYKK